MHCTSSLLFAVNNAMNQNSSGKVHVSPSTQHSAKPFIRAGLPFLLFIIGGSYFLSISIDDRLKEKDIDKGSKSDRQFEMEQEKEELMAKMSKTIQDFDNTKRIERPEEVLARRKKEREDRNRWYRRTWRWVTGQK